MPSFTNLIYGSGTRVSWSIDLVLARSSMSLTKLKFSVCVLHVVIGSENKLWLGFAAWLIALSTGGGEVGPKLNFSRRAQKVIRWPQKVIRRPQKVIRFLDPWVN